MKYVRCLDSGDLLSAEIRTEKRSASINLLYFRVLHLIEVALYLIQGIINMYFVFTCSLFYVMLRGFTVRYEKYIDTCPKYVVYSLLW